MVALPSLHDELPCTRAALDPGHEVDAADARSSIAKNLQVRDRHQLPAAAIPGAVRCAAAADDALRTLEKYDIPAVHKALVAAGLGDVVDVRKHQSRDYGYGLTFGAWTGQACVVGWVDRAQGYEVEYGSQTADGGCLPAPD